MAESAVRDVTGQSSGFAASRIRRGHELSTRGLLDKAPADVQGSGMDAHRFDTSDGSFARSWSSDGLESVIHAANPALLPTCAVFARSASYFQTI